MGCRNVLTLVITWKITNIGLHYKIYVCIPNFMCSGIGKEKEKSDGHLV